MGSNAYSRVIAVSGTIAMLAGTLLVTMLLAYSFDPWTAITGPESEPEFADTLSQRPNWFNVRIEDRLIALDAALLKLEARLRAAPTGDPVPGSNTSSGFGWRMDPVTGESSFHHGIDYRAPVGTPVRAAGEGVVTRVAVHGDFGRVVEVTHGDGLVSRYAHLSRALVHERERVTRGQALGRVGASGKATGPHLHYEVLEHGRSVDPVRFPARKS